MVAGTGYGGSNTFDSATNRITTASFAHDGSGNLTANGPATSYTYDQENRMVTAAAGSVSYGMDAQGRRKRQTVGGVTTDYFYSGSEVVAEKRGYAWTDYVFWGDQRVAQVNMGPANPGWEEDMAGWDNWAGGSVVTDATKAHTGNKYLQLSTTGAWVGVGSSYVLGVTPGQSVTFGGWALRESGSGGYAQWALAAYDSSMTPIAYYGVFPLDAGSTWTYQTYTAQMPAGAAYVRLYNQIYLSPGAAVARFDDGFVQAGTTYLHTDHLGSTRVCTDASGVSTGACDYEPFGEVQPGTTCSVPTAFRFAGMRFDSDTGLYHTPFRQYDPNQARWMGVDAIPGSNRFTFVLNDPVNLADPMGLSAQFINGQVGNCTLDGITVDCNQAQNWISSGTFVCPLQSGNCEGYLTINGLQVWGYIPQFYWDSTITSSPGRVTVTVDLQLARWVLLGHAEQFDWLVFSSNFFAGAGDELTFGLTKLIREKTGGDVVNPCSKAYKAGEWTGFAVSTAGGVAGGIKAAGTKAVGKEFSHWIPRRLGGARSILNGNFVTPKFHYLTDPFRYPKGWRAFGDKLNPALQQLGRIPFVYDGAAAGAAVGGASMATRPCP